MLDWLLIATGFTGALTLVFAYRSATRRFGLTPRLVPHFSPKGGCTDAIVRELSGARREILVQAYSFSCPAIAGALIAARRRGVAIHVLLDRSNEKETYSELGPLEQHGLEVLIDAHHAIAHNKVIIIDRRTLLTGSFNFTRQAEQENAENLLVISSQPEVLDAYVHNFLSHRDHAQTPAPAASAITRGNDVSHRRIA
jgi:phosphatidylserine/phosphatidylglycerophosphate/cardiolipin synthase-like enzyme